MSDLTLFKKDKLPAYLKNIQLDETTKSLMGSAGGIPRISIKGSVFRKIVDGEEVMKNEDRAMNVVIVKSASTEYRTFYAGTFKEGENKGPDCWSSDGVSPDANVASPQSPQCATCSQNIKGSGQGDSRACRYSRWLAVALENDLEGDILQLALPAQSIFGKGEKGRLPLRAYSTFMGGHGLPITAVVTEMRFDTDSATPKLTFKPVRTLTEEEYLLCRDRAESPQALEAVTMRYSPSKSSGVEADDESIAVAKAAALALKGKVTVPAEDDEAPEPKVRGKTKEADVKSVLDQWADDDE
jgi:hypothetical protein